METLNDPISIHTITAVYLATGLSLHALERVGELMRDTEAAATDQNKLFEQSPRSA
jgi:hypothetical protein